MDFAMKFIFIFISKLLGLIPKSENILVFNSFPDYTDNSYAVYRYLMNNKKYKYKLIWIFNDKTSICKYQEVTAYYKFSFKAFYYFAKAKFVFSTHGLYSFLELNQGLKLVNLWHGMPLKTIGSMDLQRDGSSPTKADYLIATSEFFQKIMAKSFNDLPIDRVLLTGQPRNDLLFEETLFFENYGIDIKQFNSIGIWLPTYRQSIVGDIRKDGVYNENGISFLTMNELQKLDDFLQKSSSLLIVKLHPMDALQYVDFAHLKNLIIIKPKEFKEQLYPLLGKCDYLLTDYSSVWIDYCILKRPIGFVMNDIEEYKKSRGLTIENLDEKLPGTIINTFDKLTSFISNLPEFDNKNVELYNKYFDNKASERLINYFNL